MFTQRIVLIAALAVLVTTPVAAQVQNLADLQGRLAPGTHLVVYDDMQNRLKVRFKRVTSEGVEIAPDDSGYRTFGRGSSPESTLIPASRIVRIDEERNDGIGRGLGIGLAIGGGLALVGAVGCNQDYGEPGEDCAVAGLLLFALPGVAIGGLVDYAVKEKVTIYQAPRGTTGTQLSLAPLATRRGGGARLVWTF